MSDHAEHPLALAGRDLVREERVATRRNQEFVADLDRVHPAYYRMYADVLIGVLLGTFKIGRGRVGQDEG